MAIAAPPDRRSKSLTDERLALFIEDNVVVPEFVTDPEERDFLKDSGRMMFEGNLALVAQIMREDLPLPHLTIYPGTSLPDESGALAMKSSPTDFRIKVAIDNSGVERSFEEALERHLHMQASSEITPKGVVSNQPRVSTGALLATEDENNISGLHGFRIHKAAGSRKNTEMLEENRNARDAVVNAKEQGLTGSGMKAATLHRLGWESKLKQLFEDDVMNKTSPRVWLRRLREQNGTSRADMARHLRLSRDAYGLFEDSDISIFPLTRVIQCLAHNSFSLPTDKDNPLLVDKEYADKFLEHFAKRAVLAHDKRQIPGADEDAVKPGTKQFKNTSGALDFYRTQRDAVDIVAKRLTHPMEMYWAQQERQHWESTLNKHFTGPEYKSLKPRDWLRKLRVLNGISMPDMGKKLGISESAYGYYERDPKALLWEPYCCQCLDKNIFHLPTEKDGSVKKEFAHKLLRKFGHNKLYMKDNAQLTSAIKAVAIASAIDKDIPSLDPAYAVPALSYKNAVSSILDMAEHVENIGQFLEKYAQLIGKKDYIVAKKLGCDPATIGRFHKQRYVAPLDKIINSNAYDFPTGADSKSVHPEVQNALRTLNAYQWEEDEENVKPELKYHNPYISIGDAAQALVIAPMKYIGRTPTEKIGDTRQATDSGVEAKRSIKKELRTTDKRLAWERYWAELKEDHHKNKAVVVNGQNVRCELDGWDQLYVHKDDVAILEIDPRWLKAQLEVKQKRRIHPSNPENADLLNANRDMRDAVTDAQVVGATEAQMKDARLKRRSWEELATAHFSDAILEHHSANDWLRQLRQISGVTPAELIEFLQIPPKAYYDYENSDGVAIFPLEHGIKCLAHNVFDLPTGEDGRVRKDLADKLLDHFAKWSLASPYINKKSGTDRHRDNFDTSTFRNVPRILDYYKAQRDSIDRAMGSAGHPKEIYWAQQERDKWESAIEALFTGPDYENLKRGEWLSKLRVLNGLSAQELGKSLNIAVETVSQIEHEKVEFTLPHCHQCLNDNIFHLPTEADGSVKKEFAHKLLEKSGHEAWYVRNKEQLAAALKAIAIEGLPPVGFDGKKIPPPKAKAVIAQFADGHNKVNIQDPDLKKSCLDIGQWRKYRLKHVLPASSDYLFAVPMDGTKNLLSESVTDLQGKNAKRSILMLAEQAETIGEFLKKYSQRTGQKDTHVAVTLGRSHAYIGSCYKRKHIPDLDEIIQLNAYNLPTGEDGKMVHPAVEEALRTLNAGKRYQNPFVSMGDAARELRIPTMGRVGKVTSTKYGATRKDADLKLAEKEVLRTNLLTTDKRMAWESYWAELEVDYKTNGHKDLTIKDRKVRCWLDAWDHLQVHKDDIATLKKDPRWQEAQFRQRFLNGKNNDGGVGL